MDNTITKESTLPVQAGGPQPVLGCVLLRECGPVERVR